MGGGPRWSLKMGKRIDYVVEALIFFFGKNVEALIAREES